MLHLDNPKDRVSLLHCYTNADSGIFPDDINGLDFDRGDFNRQICMKLKSLSNSNILDRNFLGMADGFEYGGQVDRLNALKWCTALSQMLAAAIAPVPLSGSLLAVGSPKS